MRHLTANGHDPTKQILFHGRDSKYTAEFDEKLAGAGIDVRLTPYRSPNLNAYVERWIQSIRVECLNQFIAIGEAHLNYLVREFVEPHHHERPHQGRENLTLDNADLPEAPSHLPFPKRVECRERLGGVQALSPSGVAYPIIDSHVFQRAFPRGKSARRRAIRYCPLLPHNQTVQLFNTA